MLVISRRPSETLIIGQEGQIKIKILKIQGQQIRMGIEASKDISIDREEVYLLKQQRKKTTNINNQTS